MKLIKEKLTKFCQRKTPDRLSQIWNKGSVDTSANKKKRKYETPASYFINLYFDPCF